MRGLSSFLPLLLYHAGERSRLVDATLVLNGVILQDGGPVDPNPLRGIHAGDIWAPPIKGSNILRCGSWGTESYWGAYRGELYPGQKFSVNGSIPVPNGGGWLSFSVLAGEDPLFGLGDDTALANFEVPNRKFQWQTELTLPESWPVGKDFTMQVAFKSKSAEFPFYQCIDLHSVEAPPTPDPFPYSLVIGIASAVLAVCCILGCVCLCWIQKKRKRREQEYEESWDPKRTTKIHKGTPSNSGAYVYGDVSGLTAKDISISHESNKKHSRGDSTSGHSRTPPHHSRSHGHHSRGDPSPNKHHRENKQGTFEYAEPPGQFVGHHKQQKHSSRSQSSHSSRSHSKQHRHAQAEYAGKYASRNAEREKNRYAYEPHAIYGPQGKSPSVSRGTTSPGKKSHRKGGSRKKDRRDRRDRDSPVMRI